MSEKYIMSIDQGTTGTTVLVIDKAGKAVSRGYHEITQYYPQPGWVEHDAQEIWAVTIGLAKQVLMQANIHSNQIAGIGITNQRETTVVWDKNTGLPVSNAIVWQCRRTAGLCDSMKNLGMDDLVRRKTGLVIDAYFSATKLCWILDNVPRARQRAENGELLFGTIDTWLVWKLSGGRTHVSDYSNASRTMLYNIKELKWDEELLDYFRIPAAMMPAVKDSSCIYSYTDPDVLGTAIPIAGIAGDQQAALFGQGCLEPGCVKNTYGTGCFMLMNTGQRLVYSEHGLLTTIAWGLQGHVSYAVEGSVFVAGAAVQWLRDEMKVIAHASETEALASTLENNAGVYLVPAFVGMGAPYWDMYARGTIVGLTRGTGRAHIARAVLESIAYQTNDVLEVMAGDAGLAINSLKVDGGAAANNFLMQFQADILGMPVERPLNTESTAIGAAFLAGLAVGYWSSPGEIKNTRIIDRTFIPSMEQERRIQLVDGWKRAVLCALAYKS